MVRKMSLTVTNCFELFRNRYEVSRPVRGSPTGATSATHHLSQQRFDLVETTIPAIQDALEDHIINVQKLVRMENGVGRRQGALAGIPIVLKDNVGTRDMPTTAGSLAFEGSVSRTDAFITRNACAFRIARTDDD